MRLCQMLFAACLTGLSLVTFLRADEYANLASLVAEPLFATPKQAEAGWQDDAVMLRLEFARRAIHELDASPLAQLGAKETHARVLAKLEACRGTLENIRALDNTAPDYAGIVDKTLQASPALWRDFQQQTAQAGDQEVVNLLIAKGLVELANLGAKQWQLAEARDDYRRHYAEMNAAALDLIPVAKARPCLHGIGLVYASSGARPHQTLHITRLIAGGPAEKAGLRVGDALVSIAGEPVFVDGELNRKARDQLQPGTKGSRLELRIARDSRPSDVTVERSLILNDVPNLLKLAMRGSCDGALASDMLVMTNQSGIELTNCTLLVRLVADDARQSQHVHFVKHWPAEATLFGMYHQPTEKCIAGNGSFPFVKEVHVEVYTDQFQGQVKYNYWNSEERRADLRNYCENHIQFTGAYLSETDGLFRPGDGLYQSPAGVRIWLSPAAGQETAQLKPREIIVQLYKGRDQASVVWEGREWRGGGVAPFQTFVDKKFNALKNPNDYEVRLRFHGTDYEHLIRFDDR